MAQSFAILSQEERQREMKPLSHMALESTLLNASGYSSTGNRSNLFCEYCKRTGRTKYRCYKLHGYPTNTRTPRGRGSGTATNVHTSEDDRSQYEETPEHLSKSQYEQLLNLLGTLQVGNGTDCSGNMSSGAANLAGPFSEEPSGTW
ncbi:uncharacterized protein LOC125835533 [Solanum verrucosum]|uniref:uncharacterized protein LOC125835533 n=1 Tax=Solanum verrucosum TaxID=315347 RepID=UPI0020D0D0BB|nr:uncharacterized protein LOC125835533 [Solanum verrucosum]